MINLFVIDDHPAILSAMEFLLFSAEEGVGYSGASLSVPEALIKMKDLELDVILLDLFIGDSTPCDNVSLLRQIRPGIPIVIYTAEDSTWWKYRMFESGVNAFVNKSSVVEKLLQTILCVADGSVQIPTEVKDLLDPLVQPGKSTFLTGDELEICRGICFGFSIKEVADNVNKSPSMVEKTLRIARMKTGAHSNPDLVRILIAHKLVPIQESCIFEHQ